MVAWPLFYVMLCVNCAIKEKLLCALFINRQVKFSNYLIRMFRYTYSINSNLNCVFRLYLLAEGRVAYFGSTSKAEKFFSR